MTQSRWTLLALISGALLLSGCDLVTKHVARVHLRGQAPVELVSGVLQLHYVENRDTGFGLLRFVPLSQRRALIIGLQLATLGVVLLLWRQRARAAAGPLRLVEQLPFVLLLAGAAGNLVERIARGYVVDFIHLRYWPVFNLADILIVVGGALLVLSWRSQPARPSP